MQRFRTALIAFCACVAAAPALAEPEYVTIKLEIDIAKPAGAVWAKVGGYCDISAWLNNVDCKITSGDGGVGTVRVLAGGRVTEILVAQTEQGRGILGVVDGFSPKGVEDEEGIAWRKDFLRMIGYKTK